MFSELDMYRTDPAQHPTTAGEELDDLHHDLTQVCPIPIPNSLLPYTNSKLFFP